ncbi:MAG TPA: hypothetical protein VF323_12735, partial [Candidatus Limnocylindrales bacterium]
EAQGRIAALMRRELVTLDDEPRSPGRGQLAFVQEVVHDVAYSTVSRRDRRSLHVAAADHLASLDDEELVEAVAEHLLAAHAAAPTHPDAPDVARRAVDALRVAAARALALRVPAQALIHLRRALELVGDDAVRAEMWSEAAVAARAAARFDLAEAYLRQLIDWQTRNGQPAPAARTRALLASLLLATERHGSALGDLEAALDGVGDIAFDASTVELGGQLARAHVLVGHDRLGLDWANRTLEAAATLDLPGVAVDALITRGTAQMRLGNDVAGLDDLHRAIADAQRLDLIGAELRARNNLAWLVAPDDPQVTMATARGGLDLATRMGVGDMALQLAGVVCASAVDTGDWDAALAVLDEVRDRPKAPAHRIDFASVEATIRALRGDAGAAAVLEALEPVEPDTDPQILSGMDLARAWIAFLDGRLDDARRLAGGAGARSLGAERLGALVLAARAALWLEDRFDVAAQIAALAALDAKGRAVEAAELTLRAGLAALGGEESAGPMYAEAVAAWRSIRLPLHLAVCLAERQRFLPALAGADEDAGGDEAEAILADLGATGMLGVIRPVTSPAALAPRP